MQAEHSSLLQQAEQAEIAELKVKYAAMKAKYAAKEAEQQAFCRTRGASAELDRTLRGASSDTDKRDRPKRGGNDEPGRPEIIYVTVAASGTAAVRTVAVRRHSLLYSEVPVRTENRKQKSKAMQSKTKSVVIRAGLWHEDSEHRRYTIINQGLFSGVDSVKPVDATWEKFKKQLAKEIFDWAHGWDETQRQHEKTVTRMRQTYLYAQSSSVAEKAALTDEHILWSVRQAIVALISNFEGFLHKLMRYKIRHFCVVCDRLALWSEVFKVNQKICHMVALRIIDDNLAPDAQWPTLPPTTLQADLEPSSANIRALQQSVKDWLQGTSTNRDDAEVIAVALHLGLSDPEYGLCAHGFECSPILIGTKRNQNGRLTETGSFAAKLLTFSCGTIQTLEDMSQHLLDSTDGVPLKIPACDRDDGPVSHCVLSERLVIMRADLTRLLMNYMYGFRNVLAHGSSNQTLEGSGIVATGVTGTESAPLLGSRKKGVYGAAAYDRANDPDGKFDLLPYLEDRLEELREQGRDLQLRNPPRTGEPDLSLVALFANATRQIATTLFETIMYKVDLLPPVPPSEPEPDFWAAIYEDHPELAEPSEPEPEPEL